MKDDTLNLTPQDYALLNSMGIDENKISHHLTSCTKGTNPIELVKAATVNDGIRRFDNTERDALITNFAQASASLDLVKFVPASGAATRMFKTLLHFYNEYDEIVAETIKQKAPDNEDYQFMSQFIEGIKTNRFAFIEDLKNIMADNGIDMEEDIKQGQYKTILHYLLTEKGLDYTNLPKAALKFHRYNDHARTAVEEHLVEGKAYAKNKNGDVYLHFTLSPQFKERISNYLESVRETYQGNEVTFHFEFSEQHSSTNTVAVTLDNHLFRDSSGQLVLIPAGHGSLIENLNELKEDIVFIKNIDNIVQDHFKEETTLNKKMLAGCLLKAQAKTFEFLKILESGDITNSKLEEIALYSTNELNITFPTNDFNLNRKEMITFLKTKLNRPIRVCGIVENKGEPGGGPFWVKDKDGSISLQIVEAAQIDVNSTKHRQIMNSASHFNPVDLVCGIKNDKGNTFNLLDYVDNEAYFIVEKSRDGKSYKALELPGLWNGAMANWITIFVEVPIITFNPTKTINDLLRPHHQHQHQQAAGPACTA
jgi:Domain of unknown function (DUF4301)